MPKLVTITIRSREDTLPGLGNRTDVEVEQFVRNDFTRTFNELGWDVVNVVSTSAEFPGLFPREAPRLFPRLYPEGRGQTQMKIGPGGQLIGQPRPEAGVTTEATMQGRRVSEFLAPGGKTGGFSYKIGEEPPPANARSFAVDTEEKTTGLHFTTTVAAMDENEAMRIVERNPRFSAISAKPVLGG